MAQGASGRTGGPEGQVGQEGRVGQVAAGWGRSARTRVRTEKVATPPAAPPPLADKPSPTREERKRTDAEAKRRSRAEQARRSSIDRLESKIAETERAIREIEQTMSAPGFYEDRIAAQPVIDRHQALMWEVGDLMRQWELLQQAAELAPTSER